MIVTPGSRLSTDCRTRHRSSRAPSIVGHGSASELAPSVALRRILSIAIRPFWHRRPNRVFHNNSARPIASAIFCARFPLSPWLGRLTRQVERCSERDENGNNKRKGAEENERSIRNAIAASPRTPCREGRSPSIELVNIFDLPSVAGCQGRSDTRCVPPGPSGQPLR